MIAIETHIRKLEYQDWIQQSTRHKADVASIVDDYLDQKQHQFKNPVIDFLFTYYNFRPAALKRWSPGTDTLLKDAAHHIDFEQKEFSKSDQDVILESGSFPNKRQRALQWMYQLLLTTKDRQPLLNCCGMHEWAMVYKAEEIRHQNYPLRLSNTEIREFVETQPIVCTHFDAYRFFTPEAKPLNKHTPSREFFEDTEQPGCLHTNMDLYKWAYKLSPWISSEVILDAFKLAVKARTLDMKAGPYDLSSIGYEPIPIETEAGRIRYKQEQAMIWKASIPVREKLIEAIKPLLLNKN